MTLLAPLALSAVLATYAAPDPNGPAAAAEVVAVRASKALTCSDGGPAMIVDPVVLVQDGRIAAIGPASEVDVPEGAEVIDYGEAWLAPGFVDLHSHVGGSRGDINDMVYQLNSELRVAPAVIPNNPGLHKPLAAGVTTILFIPGSGTNIGGQGVLMKCGLAEYEDAVIRDPGSLKIAQGDNPTRWGYGMGRILMNWGLRYRLRRGRAYAEAWQAFEAGEGPRPERELELDVFRSLYAGETQVSTHTQYYQLVLMSITMLARDFGLPTFIDHGSFDSYLTAPLAMEYGVAAILGPREIMAPRPPRFDTDGRIEGTGWGFIQHGMNEVGFNTDAPVVPQESLHLQAAMGVRYGLDNDAGQGLRGVTIVPARTAGIAHRVGSLEVGKDADIIVTLGDPIDPRTEFVATWVNGQPLYDGARDGRAW
ncbi:MAG: amidohydrolase family protein [Planctomycetota bacterium]